MRFGGASYVVRFIPSRNGARFSSTMPFSSGSTCRTNHAARAIAWLSALLLRGLSDSKATTESFDADGAQWTKKHFAADARVRVRIPPLEPITRVAVVADQRVDRQAVALLAIFESTHF